MSQIKRNTRNNSLDSLKLICALLVVFIHCNYPYKSELLPITDVAVPLFFCISGYLIFGVKRNCTRIGRIGKIFAWVFVLYLLKTEAFRLTTSHQLFIPTFEDIIHLVCFNDVVFSIHLWYLSAYLYVLIIAFLIDKYDLWKSSFYAILPLIIIGVLIKLWVNETSPERIYYYRNAFFVGLPYFLTGALIKKNARHNCLNVRCLHVVIVAVLVVLFIVRYLIVGQSLIILTVIELDLLLLTAGIFFLTISYKQEADNIISWLGRKYSLYIYIFHLLIMSAIQMAVSYLPTELNNVYMYFNPIVVFLFSIGLTYVLNKMKIIKI